MSHGIKNIKFAQAPKWDGKENDLDKRDRETSELTKSSIISKEQLEIDQGKMKKVKSEKVTFKIRVFSFPNLTVYRIFRSSEFFNHSNSSITSIVAPLQFSENFEKNRSSEFFDCPNFVIVRNLRLSEFSVVRNFSIDRICD